MEQIAINNSRVISELPETLEAEEIPEAATVSHQEFIEIVGQAAHLAFHGENISDPAIRVSHPIKGRIPEAVGKPAKDLLEVEKTTFYERMAFLYQIPSISEDISGNRLSLSLGGVRAYNLENHNGRKCEERFKVFIGFQNWVCTNLCVSTDGFLEDLRVRTLSELFNRVVHAVGIILAHNHPSNNPTPSESDVEITRKLIEAGKVLSITVLDHLVICGDGSYYSLGDEGRL